MEASVDQVITGRSAKGQSVRKGDRKKISKLLRRSGVKDAVAWVVQNFDSPVGKSVLKKSSTPVYSLIPSAMTKDVNEHGPLSARLATYVT